MHCTDPVSPFSLPVLFTKLPVLHLQVLVVVASILVQNTVGGMKTLSTSTQSMVRRPAVSDLASSHQASGRRHDEA